MSKELIVTYFSRSGGPMYSHERATLSVVAQAIARIKDCEFGGDFDSARHRSQNLFFVPNDTLIADEALELGVSTTSSLFGGIVPYPFVKTKAITHQLVTDGAHRPEGWSTAFAKRVESSVLPGFTAFSAADARIAAERLLVRGTVRLKDPLCAAGNGQTVIATARALDEFLEQYPMDNITTHGLVVETNLRRAMTRSVGQIAIGNLMIAYHGTQNAVVNNEGRMAYGGSHLKCVRGGWEALDGLPMQKEIRLAVDQARAYDQATSEYPGFLASRRNYDVGQGFDDEHQWRSGVFEASWRSGGASTAELAAVTEFERDPTLQMVEASAVKEFGSVREAPRGSVVHFQGDDPEDGPLLRYTLVMRALRQAA